MSAPTQELLEEIKNAQRIIHETLGLNRIRRVVAHYALLGELCVVNKSGFGCLEELKLSFNGMIDQLWEVTQ